MPALADEAWSKWGKTLPNNTILSELNNQLFPPAPSLKGAAGSASFKELAGLH